MNAAWPKVTFDDAPLQIIDGDRGSNYPKQDEFHDEGHCLFLNTGNVTKSGFDFGNCQFITEQKDSLLRKGKLSREDVIMTTRGTIGNVGYFNRNVPFEHIRINSGMVIFRVNREKLLPSFLYQYLRSEQFNKQVNSLRSGAAQPQLPIRDIKVIELPLPSVDQQEAISGLISKYDDLIENNKRRIELLEESARQLYKEWFVRFRFPGHEHVKIIDGVPERWNPKTLSDIATVVKDTVDPKNIPETTPYIGLEHLPRRSITLNEWENAGKVTSSKFSFKCGDIIFGKIRPYFHKVGFTLTDGITSSDAIVLRPKMQNHYCIALAEVSSDAFVALASKTVREGSKMPRADWDVLKNRIVLEPPEAILNVFNNQIEGILNQCKLLSFQNFSLIKARDILLPKIMSRKIAV